MKQRLKRFLPKSKKAIIFQITLNDQTYGGVVVDISLASASFLFKGVVKDIEDHVAEAQITTQNETFSLGKVMVVRHEVQSASLHIVSEEEDGTDRSGFTLIVVKALKDHIPLEHLMKYLESDGQSPYEFELAHGKFTLADFYGYSGSDDILEKTRLLARMQSEWKQKHSYQYERYRLPSLGKRVRLDRLRPDGRDDYIAFGSNDYLGFASHPEVIKAAQSALAVYGMGSTGSPVSTGLSQEHRMLNEMLARMFHKPSSLLFNSGYAANLGILGALCREKDLVLYDRIVHASIQDALVFASANGATCLPFRHNDADSLESLLLEHRDHHRGCLVVTEGIFSMDGHIANLEKMVPLVKKHHARLFLDVAHDFGVIGENGLGAAEMYGVLKDVDIIMGTFSKIAGAIGGFVVSSEEVVEYLRVMSRPHIFTVSIPPSTAAAVNKALSLFWEDKSYLLKLKQNIRYFVRGLRSLGLPIDADHQSTICPVIIGDEAKLDIMTKILYDHGVSPTPVVYPVVSRDRCRFRFTVTALHDQSDLDYALVVLRMALLEVGLIKSLKGTSQSA